jgi:NADPH:quinone reductase-like Zn-dependent oxidoreductase
MKQIRFEAFGSPSLVARCVDVPAVGAPSAWEVVVEVEAFPINVADLAMLAGRYGTLPKPPATIGMEAVGRIIETGASVKNLQTGDRVILLANHNWSEHRRVPAAAVHKIPADADPLQFAMLKVNPATAAMLLQDFATLQEGDWVIQTAPLSSVGQCVLQIARSKSLRTINIVRSAAAIPEVIERGGDIAILDGPDLAARLRERIGHDSVMLALDAVAGPGIDSLAECLSDDGQIVNYGMLSGLPCQLNANHTIFRGITLKGFWLSRVLNRLSQPERTKLFDSLGEMLMSGKLKLSVDSCFPMSSIGDALRRAEQSGRSGKVIVQPKPQMYGTQSC